MIGRCLEIKTICIGVNNPPLSPVFALFQPTTHFTHAPRLFGSEKGNKQFLCTNRYKLYLFLVADDTHCFATNEQKVLFIKSYIMEDYKIATFKKAL